MQAVILAGGKGTRLRPLTDQIPKPMAPVKGKPFLEYLILYLKKYQLTNIVICAGSLWEKIIEYFNDGKNWGIEIEYSLEKDKLLGTGGALKLAEKLLAEEFIVLNGDTFLPLDYQDFISTFTERNHLALLAVYDNSEFLEPGNIQLNKDYFITNYNRDKRTKDLNYIDAGVAIYRKQLLDLIPAGREVSLEREIYPALISRQELAGYPLSTKFFDIGTAEKLEVFSQYLECNPWLKTATR